MTKSTYKGRGYGRGYKVSKILEAFKKMPEYRRGFKTEALWKGGQVRRELGNPAKKISGRKLVDYLKKKRGFSYDKIDAFFRGMSSAKPSIPKPATPSSPESIKKLLQRPSSPKEKISAKEWQPTGKLKPTEKPKLPLNKEKPRPTKEKSTEWIKEIGRQRIIFERRRKTISYSRQRSKELPIKPEQAGMFLPETEQPLPKAPKTHQEIVQKEKERLAEHYRTQEQNIQKSQELDEKNIKEEEQISKLMEEKFGSSKGVAQETDSKGETTDE